MNLGEGKARIGKDYSGYCTFVYKWLPRPAIWFVLVSDKAPDPKELPGESILAILPESTNDDVPVIIRSASKTDDGYEYKGFISTPFFKLIPITSTECDRVLFHIPNYLGFGLGPIGLDFGKWEITIHPVINFKELIKQLTENDGYAITQLGILKRRDGKSFDATRIHTVLNRFRDLRSFLEGGWSTSISYWNER